MTTRWFAATHLHQPDGWLSPGFVEVDEHGTIVNVTGERPAAESDLPVQLLDGFVVPGMPNVHSHAHQRGLAGRAEVGASGSEDENFWTWRERMYRFANTLTPDDLEAIAAQAFVEMVKAGFTTVGEFHYLHHDPAGRPYQDPAEMSARIVSAARMAGLAVTLLPVLYTQGGIDRPPAADQRRFISNGDLYARIVEAVASWQASDPLLRTGIAPHSLRAVTTHDLSGVVPMLAERYLDAPIHIHVAEQVREVEEVLAGRGARPGAWLLQHAAIDDRWTFIHATHFDDSELEATARASAVAGLCPTTEAGLGDGLFPLANFVARGGRWGVGTDSNSRISVAEELRVLAYGQRLANRSFTVLPPPSVDEVARQPGRELFDRALAGGAQSLRQPIGGIVPGRRADFVVLDPDDPALVAHEPATVLDGWVFSGTSSAVRDVWISGQLVVENRRHLRETDIYARFRRTLHRLA